MIFFGVDMFERRVELYDGAIDGVVPESASDIIHRTLQLLQFLSLSLVLKQLELFWRCCRDQVTAADSRHPRPQAELIDPYSHTFPKVRV